LHRIRRNEVDRTQSVFEQPAMVSFYTELAKRMFERNWLNLSALLVSGEVAAIHFGFEYSGNLLYYMPTFNHSYMRYSVGRSLLIHLLNDCFAHEFKEFDLLMGSEPYKFDFKPNVRKLYSVTFFHRNPRAKVAKIWFRRVRPKLEALINRSRHVHQIRAWFRKV
jgi:CelD/BcsL family acetyltransferase involved in cellulose biosynthesis